MIVLSQEEAIERFRAAHGDRYDYSRTNYISMAEELIVICPDHGPFWVKGLNHAFGSGCPECPGYRLTKARFIQEGIAMHGDIHDYSKVPEGLRGRAGKVTLVCKLHDQEFNIPIKYHLGGRIGCEVCAEGDEVMPRQTFIRASKNNYGSDVFDYKLAPFTIRSKDQEIRLTCLEHDNLFTQTAGEHLDTRSGCEQCGYPEKHPLDLKIDEKLASKERQNRIQREKRDQFIEASIAMHGDIHDYGELPKRITMTTVIPLTCRIHKKHFNIVAKSHLEGDIGCQECALGDDVMSKQVYRNLSIESYGKGAFDYSGLPKMIRSGKQVIHLTCLQHNHTFTQTAGEHLGKHSGCEPCGFPKRKPLTEKIRKKRELARALRLKARDKKREELKMLDLAIEQQEIVLVREEAPSSDS